MSEISPLAPGSTTTEQWVNLIKEAQTAADQQLNQELESYLVFLLMRFTDKPEMAASLLAIEYLSSMLNQHRPHHNQLRDVGDKCLLYSGFFPHRAQALHVNISYFVNLGRSAYSQLSSKERSTEAIMYSHLALAFIPLMDVLQSMRELGDKNARLSTIHAFELWHDTGSRHAFQTLRSTTQAIPGIPKASDLAFDS